MKRTAILVAMATAAIMAPIGAQARAPYVMANSIVPGGCSAMSADWVAGVPSCPTRIDASKDQVRDKAVERFRKADTARAASSISHGERTRVPSNKSQSSKLAPARSSGSGAERGAGTKRDHGSLPYRMHGTSPAEKSISIDRAATRDAGNAQRRVR